jgi:hypothetical protein
MRDDEPEVPEPPVVDVRDWPPRSASDDAREELDRGVGTLGVGGEADDIEPGGRLADDPDRTRGASDDRRA